MNCDSCELPKNAWITALTVRAFTRSSRVIRSGSLLMLIRSLMSRAMRDRPTENWLAISSRSEEHTSELQSRLHLVCRLLLEKKKKKKRGETRLHVKYTPSEYVHAEA